MKESTFGPSALLTPANGVSIARILFTFPLIWLIVDRDGPSLAALALWTVLTWSDGLDGILARRYGRTTSGAFLDPLADKILILGAMFTLVALDKLWWVPVGVITAREVAISVYRSVVSRQGVSVPAVWLAKVKVVIQGFAVGFALLPHTAENSPQLAGYTLWVAAALTVYTGYDYLRGVGAQPVAVEAS